MNSQSIKEEDIKIIDFQILVSTIFIFSTIISIFISYNERYNLIYGKRIINSNISTNIVKINRIIITLILISFIYISFKTKELDIAKGKNVTPDNLEITAAIFSLVAGLIVLYVVFKYGDDSIVVTENPDI